MTFYILLTWKLLSPFFFCSNFGKPSLICRTSLWTCTFVSFGRIPAYHSRNVRGSRSWWWVLNTLIWFGYPIRSLSMKKRPTSTKPRRKTNSSESCTQGKFCGALGTAFSTSLYLCASVQTLLCEKKIRKYFWTDSSGMSGESHFPCCSPFLWCRVMKAQLPSSAQICPKMPYSTTSKVLSPNTVCGAPCMAFEEVFADAVAKLLKVSSLLMLKNTYKK